MTRPKPRSSRPGFTAIEVLVVLAVLAILAAVVHRQVGRSMDSGRSAALAQSLDGLRQAIYQYRTDVRRYPRELVFLSAQPASATDLCGRNVPAGFLEQWRGPYTAQPIGATGIQVGDARIQNALEPDPATLAIEQTGTLSIVVTDVDVQVAEALDRAYDGDGSLTTGVVRWSEGVVGSGRGTLRFSLAVRGC